MKIAFVSQPIDTVLPPFQNSVGACTWGTALALAKQDGCEVTAYGLQDRHPDVSETTAHHVRFRFVPSTAFDRAASSVRSKVSKLRQFSSPASTSSLLFPGYGRRVAAALQQDRPDVIHIQHCSQYVPVIRKFNPQAKIVLQLHAEWFSQSDKQVLLRRMRNLDLLLGVSDHISNRTNRDFPALRSRCETIYDGFEAAEFCLAKDYAVSDGREEKQIMYAGGISPHKGVHVLLAAFELVLAQHPKVRLAIIGPPGTYPLEETFDLRDRASLRDLKSYYAPQPLSALLKRALLGAKANTPEYASQLRSNLSPALSGKVDFLGMIPRPELIKHYYDSDLFVFSPVWDEGFGLPPVEAMAAGTPVVASQSGAIVETVQDGRTGLLVAKNDPRGLAGAMLKLLGDRELREKMGRAGRKRVTELFSWDRIAADLLAKYRRILPGGANVNPEVTEQPEAVLRRG